MRSNETSSQSKQLPLPSAITRADGIHHDTPVPDGLVDLGFGTSSLSWWLLLLVSWGWLMAMSDG
jgi:hypothetical protein